jgi:macrolide transport system ATP-binding/permease protein
MISFFRKVGWWLQRRRKEDELREELEFHLAEEANQRQDDGLSEDEAEWAARRDLGNAILLWEDVRAWWSWQLLEQLAQDVRYSLRGMFKNRMFTTLAALSLALGIGANTAIYSFMDAILLRSLPVADPASLIVVKWHSGPVNRANGDPFVMHSADGRTYRDASGVIAAIFPFPAFERLHEASSPVLSSLFAHKQAGSVNLIVKGEAELAQGEHVSGDFFRGLAAVPAAGRLIDTEDDRAGAAPVVVLSLGYSQRHFGDPANAIGQPMLINNVAFTVVGVAPSEFFGVDPAAAPQVYLPMRATSLLLQQEGKQAFVDQNYYWVEMMGRLKPGVDLAQAQAALAGPFAQWVASTATNDRERANLPALRLEEGAAGLDSLRRQYSKPLYVLLTMVGLILALACANTANLLLARAAARTHEMTVRLSLGAGRWRVVRQLLTESVLLAALSGGLGLLIAVVSMRALTRLLANGQQEFTLHAELNWHVLLVTLALSLLCGVFFGLAPALHATRPALIPALRDRSVSEPSARLRATVPRVSLTRVLVVGQIAISLLLLFSSGLFVRTLSNLQSISLGFNRDNVLLFELNAPQAGYTESRVAAFYDDVRRRLGEVPGVRDVTLSHASLVRAGRSHPITVNGQPVDRSTRMLFAGPRFFATMQIPVVRGRDIEERDREGTQSVAVISELFAKTYFGDQDPIGRHLEIAGSLRVNGKPMTMEVVGVAKEARYGGLKDKKNPAVVYVAYAQLPPTALGQMTYALRTDGDPLAQAAAVRQIVRSADARVPVMNMKTQAADIDQTINQEIVFARLCTAFAVLALVIACVGLYATMAYTVARRTSEIGIRMALGARRPAVIWMVLREVCVLVAVGLAISLPIVIGTSKLLESFLFEMTPNDPRALMLAVSVLAFAALLAGYGPARRASRVDPMIALRHE